MLQLRVGPKPSRESVAKAETAKWRWWSLLPRPIRNPSSGEGNRKALPWPFSPVPARGEGPGSASAKLGRWRGRGDNISPVTFVTASGQDGAGSPWGAGGEARPPPPQRMWPGCIPVGFGSDPGWGGGGLGGEGWGGGDCGAVGVGGPKRKRWLLERAYPLCSRTAATLGGKRPEGHSLLGVTAVGGGEGLAPYFLICLSPCKEYLRKVAGPWCGNPNQLWVPADRWDVEQDESSSWGPTSRSTEYFLRKRKVSRIQIENYYQSVETNVNVEITPKNT